MRAAILLAAGRSRRFAGANKLLARHRGMAVVRLARDAALRAPVGRVIVVVGHDHVRVAMAVRGPRVMVVRARGHREGMGASLRAALAMLRPIEREMFVFLGDMPAIPVNLPRLLARFMHPGVAAVRLRGPAGPGHPVLLRTPDRAMARRIGGDQGLRGLIAGPVRWVDRPSRREGDIDTRHDLARWRRTLSAPDC